jgi:hypothetical protein
MKGYNPSLGDRELYRRYFREAFEDGYNTEHSGWDRSSRDQTGDREDRGNSNGRGHRRDGYGNFGGSFQLRQTALNAGFNEGTKQGRSDRSNRNSRVIKVAVLPESYQGLQFWPGGSRSVPALLP